MEWFFKPKVQLGLWVNFAFVMFTLLASPALEVATGRLRPASLYDPPAVPYAPLPLPALPSGATATESDGRLNVSLNQDLTLVNKKGRTLVLSPSFNTRARPVELPTEMTLRFTIFSEEGGCPGACMLVVNADGSRVLESAAGGTFSTGWTREKIPGSSVKLSDGQVVETLAAEILTTRIPYETFLEIISARRVVLSLGPDKVELTHDQIEAMRDMHRRVTPPPPDVQYIRKVS